MAKKDKIPCRVCGKLFEPCAYCQEHSDTFRWRNFACSEDCARKYVAEAIEYRASQKKKKQGVRKVKNKVEVDASENKEIIKTDVNEIVEDKPSIDN